MKKVMYLFLMAGLLLSACAPAASATPAPLEKLIGTEWRLTSFSVQGKPMTIDPRWVVTLVLMDQGNLSGKSACNQFGGKYTLNENQLKTGELASTLMACLDEGVMELEGAYLNALHEGGTLKREGDKLTLTSADGKTVLEFAESRVTLPGSKWKLAGLADDMGATLLMSADAITLNFGADDEISGNGGCNNYHGTYKLDGSALTIGPVGSTKMACADDALNEQEVKYFKSLESVAAYEYREGQLILLDGAGKRLATFMPAE